MAEKHAPLKAPTSKEKPRDHYYEPHHHYDKDYQRDDKGKKLATYYVSNTQSQQYWNSTIETTKQRIRHPDVITIISLVITPLNVDIYNNFFYRSIEKVR